MLHQRIQQQIRLQQQDQQTNVQQQDNTNQEITIESITNEIRAEIELIASNSMSQKVTENDQSTIDIISNSSGNANGSDDVDIMYDDTCDLEDYYQDFEVINLNEKNDVTNSQVSDPTNSLISERILEHRYTMLPASCKASLQMALHERGVTATDIEMVHGVEEWERLKEMLYSETMEEISGHINAVECEMNNFRTGQTSVTAVNELITNKQTAIVNIFIDALNTVSLSTLERVGRQNNGLCAIFTPSILVNELMTFEELAYNKNYAMVWEYIVDKYIKSQEEAVMEYNGNLNACMTLLTSDNKAGKLNLQMIEMSVEKCRNNSEGYEKIKSFLIDIPRCIPMDFTYAVITDNNVSEMGTTVHGFLDGNRLCSDIVLRPYLTYSDIDKLFKTAMSNSTVQGRVYVFICLHGDDTDYLMNNMKTYGHTYDKKKVLNLLADTLPDTDLVILDGSCGTPNLNYEYKPINIHTNGCPLKHISRDKPDFTNYITVTRLTMNNQIGVAQEKWLKGGRWSELVEMVLVDTRCDKEHTFSTLYQETRNQFLNILDEKLTKIPIPMSESYHMNRSPIEYFGKLKAYRHSDGDVVYMNDFVGVSKRC